MFYYREIKLKKTKLLFIWCGLKRGGSETAMLNLVNLLKDSFDISILVRESICDYSNLPKVPIVISDRGKSLNLFEKLVSRILFYINVLVSISKTDIIVSSELPLVVIPSFLCSKITKKSFIVWNHSCRSELNFTTNRIADFLYRTSLKYATKVVSVSHFCESSLLDYLEVSEKRNSLVIYNSVNVSHEISFNKSFNLNKDMVQLISIGSLSPNKNFELIIDAVEVLVNEFKLNNIHLIICGEGNHRTLLEKIIKQRNLSMYIHLVGLIADVTDYICNSHILISASNSEALPTTVIEGLVNSIPIIATKTGAAEILDHGKYGYILNKSNKRELVDAILYILNNYDIAVAKAMLGKSSLSRFASLDVVKQWHNLFDETV